MDDLRILALMAALAAVFETQALHNLAPAIWPAADIQAGDIQVGSLCAGVDLNTGCAIVSQTLESPKDP